MSKAIRQPYDDLMREAATFTGLFRATKVEECITRIRKDKKVPPLVLCAFLQDHSKLIRETLETK